MSKNQPATAIKMAAAEPTPIDEREELLREGPESVSRKYHVVSLVTNVLMSLVVVGAVVMTYRLQQRVERAQEDVTKQANQFATEMEQLRIDVVTTSSENVTYLKVMLLKPGIDKQLARDISHSIVLRAREHKRDPDLVLAIVDVESNFNPNAVSHMGAMGLMQIMPVWKKSFGIELDLRHVDTSINYGLKILGSYEQTFGSLEMALTAYNRGPNGMVSDMKAGRVPFNGYAENIMRTYTRIKAWTRP